MRSHKRSLAPIMGALLVLSAGAFGLASTAALAGDCNQDIGSLTKKRQAIIMELNKVAKASPKGQLDPIAACPKLRRLSAIEKRLVDYLVKNKNWCMVPDQAISNIKKSAKRTRSVAGRACKVAEQIKKGQEAIGTGPKLPTGPL